MKATIEEAKYVFEKLNEIEIDIANKIGPGEAMKDMIAINNIKAALVRWFSKDDDLGDCEDS